jgi:hypothetical protein
MIRNIVPYLLLLALFFTVSCPSESPGPDRDVWLHTEANHILKTDGTIWHGRGANVPDTRGYTSSCWNTPDTGEVKRRIDSLVDDWGANFLRLTLESYAAPYDGSMIQWKTLVADPAYLSDIVEIVQYIGTKPGVYVLVSLWVDPSFDAMGWPTTDTADTWEVLATALAPYAYVMFGLVNEPQSNFDGAQDADCWTAMNTTTARIRTAEKAAGSRRHIVAVQGTGGWARRLDYYIDHPITAGDGQDIVYEVHVYNPVADFSALFETPSRTLPVIIGEFGPADGYMTLDDCDDLMTSAMGLEVPYLAWTFHMRCSPNLLVDNSGGGDGTGMTLEPTTWGQALIDNLATAW